MPRQSPASRQRDSIRLGAGAPGIERMEAHLHGQAFAPHRHDTYAIGVTLSGVQRFGFRGRTWHCLPGQCHVLHPDELHDGGAGTDAGFGYRIVYLDPALVQQALGGRPLPFVAEPVLPAAMLRDCWSAGTWSLEAPLDPLAQVELVGAVAALLARATRQVAPAARLDLAALARVHGQLAAEPAEPLSLPALEAATGLDRWSLARQFRAAYGTSPSRFRLQRRLDLARRLMREGQSLADAALAAGFADQSHLTRQFKQAYGLTPARWLAALH